MMLDGGADDSCCVMRMEEVMVTLMIIVIGMRIEEVMLLVIMVTTRTRTAFECSFSVGHYFRIVDSHLFKSCSNMEEHNKELEPSMHHYHHPRFLMSSLSCQLIERFPYVPQLRRQANDKLGSELKQLIKICILHTMYLEHRRKKMRT